VRASISYEHIFFFVVKSKKFDLHRVDLDMGTPERMRRSVGTRSRERTKSFRLTNMVVDEQSTNVTFKVREITQL
jgi:hypothetical protein